MKNLFNPDVNEIFVDTTTTYFEIEGEDSDEDADAEDDSHDAGGERGS